MTKNRMALVPIEANSDMALAAVDRPIPSDGEGMYRGIYRAMVAASPGSGKVSRERFISACRAASEASGPISTARAVIAALGLEIEE